MKVNLFIQTGSMNLTNAVKTAADMLNASQNGIYVNVKYEGFSASDYVSADTEFDKYESTDRQDYGIYIYSSPFVDNFFSHEHRKVALITTADWDEYFAPPKLEVYLCYQILQACLFFSASLHNLRTIEFAHIRPVGCINDFSGTKDEIKIGMASGRICPECEMKIKQFGVGNEIIQSIKSALLLVRSHAMGRRVIINKDMVFIVTKFSKHDDNDNAIRYGVTPALSALGLNPVRGDSESKSGFLLNKICEYIKESAFIIVKVDQPNLNVYFELGYAMALEKPTILICNSDAIPSLPTDIKGLEVISYSVGDFESLNRSIQMYFKRLPRFN